MSDSTSVRVASLRQLPPGKTLCVDVDDREVLLCHTPEGIFAIDNLCTHSAARLCEGKLKGVRVFCPLHGAAFDVRDGAALTRPAVHPLASHRVTVNGDDVSVTLAP